jgi:hypothetical protein
MPIKKPKDKVKSTPYEWRCGRLRVLPWQEWTPWFDRRSYNWLGLHMALVHVEYASYKEAAEINLCLFGFGVCIEWQFGPSS